MNRYPPKPAYTRILIHTSYILRHNDEKGLSKAEILNMANLLIIAGSETTATLLSGATFHLLKHPAAMEKLVNEIRTSFPDPAEMTFASLSKLKYLHACIQEGFRMYPPVPILLPRKTVQSTVINGYFIPENVSLFHYQISTEMFADNPLDVSWCSSMECVSLGSKLLTPRRIYS